MKSKQPSSARGILYTVIGGICWGFSGTCGEYLFSHYDISALWLTSIRLLTAGTILLLLTFRNKGKAAFDIWRYPRDVVQLVLFAFGGLVLCQVSYMTAISYTNAGTTTVLQNLNLVLIMLLVCCSTRRWPTKKEAFAAALAVLGTYLLATQGNPKEMVLSTPGLLWGLTTAVAVTIYTLLPATLIAKWNNTLVIGWAMLVGGVSVALAIRIWTIEVDWSAGLVLAIVAIILVGTIFSFTLFTHGISLIGPVRASMLATTEPVAATVFSFLWLGTKFSFMDLVGFACIITTVFLLAGAEAQATTAGGEAETLPGVSSEDGESAKKEVDISQ